MTAGAIRLFDERAEKFNLALPLVFILLVVLTGPGHLNPVQYQLSTWLASTVGMTVLHNTFSLSYFLLPEFRTWVAAQNQQRGRNIWLGWGFIIFLIFLYFQLDLYIFNWPWPVLGVGFSFLLAAAKLIFILRIAVATYHTVAQHYGLSLLYNKNYLNSVSTGAAERQRVWRVERAEKWLFRTYNISASLVSGIAVAAIIGPTHIFQNDWRFVIVIPVLILAAAVNIAGYWYPGRAFRRKRIFLLRLFLPPLALVSQAGLVGFYAVHGIESLFVFRHISHRSKLTDRRNFLCLTYLMCLGMLALTLVRPGPSGLQSLLLLEDPSLITVRWIFVAGAISSAITFVHYFLEGRFYHFSDPVTREHIGPLLLEPAKS